MIWLPEGTIRIESIMAIGHKLLSYLMNNLRLSYFPDQRQMAQIILINKPPVDYALGLTDQ